jgi:hypothetical protein
VRAVGAVRVVRKRQTVAVEIEVQIPGHVWKIGPAMTEGFPCGK